MKTGKREQPVIESTFPLSISALVFCRESGEVVAQETLELKFLVFRIKTGQKLHKKVTLDYGTS